MWSYKEPAQYVVVIASGLLIRLAPLRRRAVRCFSLAFMEVSLQWRPSHNCVLDAQLVCSVNEDWVLAVRIIACIVPLVLRPFYLTRPVDKSTLLKHVEYKEPAQYVVVIQGLAPLMSVFLRVSRLACPLHFVSPMLSSSAVSSRTWAVSSLDHCLHCSACASPLLSIPT